MSMAPGTCSLKTINIGQTLLCGAFQVFEINHNTQGISIICIDQLVVKVKVSLIFCECFDLDCPSETPQGIGLFVIQLHTVRLSSKWQDLAGGTCPHVYRNLYSGLFNSAFN